MTTSLQHRKQWVLLLAIGAVVAFALMALRGNAAASGATASAAKTVQIKGFAFKPGTLTVNRGSRVTWVNASNVAHTATKAGSFDTKRIAPGKSATVQFNQRGTFAYHCKIHSFMKGKVVVN